MSTNAGKHTIPSVRIVEDSLEFPRTALHLNHNLQRELIEGSLYLHWCSLARRIASCNSVGQTAPCSTNQSYGDRCCVLSSTLPIKCNSGPKSSGGGFKL